MTGKILNIAMPDRCLSPSHAPRATGDIAYANGKAYTVTYIQKNDDDVDVVQNVTLVKDGSTVYRYVGASGEVILGTSDYTDTSLWAATTESASDFTQDVANNKFESSYRNSTTTSDDWTTGGGWLRKKTYHTKTVTTVGLTDYYTHTLKADYPIAIEFIQGPTVPHVEIDTAHNLQLLNNILVPEAGTVAGADSTLILRARGSELTAAEGVAVYGTAPQFFVGEDPDDHAEITFTGGLGQKLHVEAGGNIQVNVVSEDNASSSLIIDQVLSNHGNVTIVAPHGITAYDADSVIQGKRIQLNIVSGSVGTSDLPLPVNSSYRQDGGVAILAQGDIYLRETFGNLLLAKPTAWDDPAASIYSSAGNVAITTINGSIVDGWIEGAQVLTAEEVNQLDSKPAALGSCCKKRLPSRPFAQKKTSKRRSITTTGAMNAN